MWSITSYSSAPPFSPLLLVPLYLFMLQTGFWESFMNRSIACTNSIFLSVCIIFISFSGLTDLAKISSILLNARDESRLPSFVPNFSENGLSFSTFSTMLPVGFCITFIMWIYMGSVSRISSGIFSWRRFLSKAFLHLLRWPCDFCSLTHLCDKMHLLTYVCWIKPASLVKRQLDGGDLYTVSLNSVCKYILRI